MKARDLAALLMTQPDLEVCVDGYEGGISSVQSEKIGTVMIARNVYNRWYYGEHEALTATGPSQLAPDTPVEMVWLIPRRSRDTE